MEKSGLSKNLLRLALIAVGVVGGFYIITYLVDNYFDPPPPTYMEQKMSIEQTENADPLRFLSAAGEYNSSFWGTELKIRGTITNTATVADYKDVTIQVTYYSKTKSVLGTKDYTLYEIYQPNTVTPFRLDIANFDNVNTINWKVVRALPN